MEWLNINSLEHALPLAPLDEDKDAFLAAALSRIRHVGLYGDTLGVTSVLPYLTRVQSIRLRAYDRHKTPFPPKPTPRVKSLDHLERLDLDFSTWLLHPLLKNFVLPNLAALSLCSLPRKRAGSPTFKFPALLNLRSLHFRDRDIPPPLEAFTLLPLSHFRLAGWPTLAVLSSLPSTIELLDFATYNLCDRYSSFRNGTLAPYDDMRT